jgi:hypothetical protein
MVVLNLCAGIILLGARSDGEVLYLGTGRICTNIRRVARRSAAETRVSECDEGLLMVQVTATTAVNSRAQLCTAVDSLIELS